MSEGSYSSAAGLTALSISSPLSLDGWLEFNRAKWGLEPIRRRFTEGNGDLPVLDTVIYLDKRGRVCQPRLNPYLPMRLLPTPTSQVQKVSRQLLRLTCLVAEEMYNRGLSSPVCLPPNIPDVREFQWKGLISEPRYTFLIELPYEVAKADHAVRKQIAKAVRAGYRCERTMDFSTVKRCLVASEQRQQFTHHLEHADLRLASDLLGEEVFRCYACYAPNGEVASARVVLCHPNGLALDWVAGTVAEHLFGGATQLLISFVLDDLVTVQASLFDYCGANIKSVAAAKLTWGGALQPFYSLCAPTLKELARFSLRMCSYGRWFQW